MKLSKLTTGFVVLLCLLAFTAGAYADKIPGPKGSGVSIFKPPGWEAVAAEHGGEALLIAAPKDDDAGALWAVTKAANLEKAVAGIDALIATALTDAKLGKPSKDTLNGMPALVASGTAKHEGNPANVGVLVVQPKAGTYLVVVAMVHTAKRAKYAKTVEQILAGIQPM